MESLAELSDGQKIVAMVIWNNLMIVATPSNLYAIGQDGEIALMTFVEMPSA